MRPLLILALLGALVALSMAADNQEDIVNLLSQQVMMQQLFLEERIRDDGGSGLKQVRVTRTGTRPYFTATWGGDNQAAMHDHANNIRTVGLGEFSAVLNGVEFKTRHNDYRLNMPHRTSKYWHATEPIPFPEVPKEVTNKSTVAEQITEMREWFRAFQLQNDTIRPYQKYFKANLCYLEGAWTKSNGQIEESFDSDRHFIDATSWFDLQRKIRFAAYSGRKSPKENFAFLPTKIMELRNGTIPEMAQWNYRILCQPLKDDLPLHKFRVVDDLGMRMKTKKKYENVAKTRAARFQLEPDLNLDREWSKHEKFTARKTLLDELMGQVPGKDNGPADIVDDAYGVEAETAFDGGKLNTGYYHRWYELGQADAMGLMVQRRGYSDQALFMAQTTNPKVSAQKTEQCSWVGPKKNRREVCATWEQRWTWAIPLEIIYLTPLNAWNPYNLEYRGDPRIDWFKALPVKKDENGNQRNGAFSANKAYNGTHSTLYYRTPTEFFTGNEVNSDAADTSGGALGVLDKDGVVRSVRATGTRIFLPDIAGVGVVRTRYPIFPVHAEGNSIYKELEAIKDLVTKSQTYAFMLQEKPFSGGATQDGQHTYQMNPSKSTFTTEHTHTVTISADQFKDLALGGFVNATTTLANGHQHTLSIKYHGGQGRLKIRTCDGKQGGCWDRHGIILKTQN